MQNQSSSRIIIFNVWNFHPGCYGRNSSNKANNIPSWFKITHTLLAEYTSPSKHLFNHMRNIKLLFKICLVKRLKFSWWLLPYSSNVLKGSKNFKVAVWTSIPFFFLILDDLKDSKRQFQLSYTRTVFGFPSLKLH